MANTGHGASGAPDPFHALRVLFETKHPDSPLADMNTSLRDVEKRTLEEGHEEWHEEWQTAIGASGTSAPSASLRDAEKRIGDRVVVAEGCAYMSSKYRHGSPFLIRKINHISGGMGHGNRLWIMTVSTNEGTETVDMTPMLDLLCTWPGEYTLHVDDNGIETISFSPFA